MSDIHALSGAYATDALDDLERQAFERHLDGCPICRGEVAGLTETTALLAETCAMTPPASLRSQVLAATAVSRPLPPVVASFSEHAERRRSRRPSRMTALVAAAAAVVAVGLGATVVDQVRDDDSSSQVTVSAVDQVLQAPDAQVFSKEAQGGGMITVVRSASLNRAVLRTSGLADVGPDQTREMWLLHGGSYLPAGYLPGGPDHDILLDGDPASARGFGMTIEPATGSATPSADIVALVPFTSA